MPDVEIAAAVAVVGQQHVGKRSLALALGAVSSSSRADASLSWLGQPLEVIRGHQRLAAKDAAALVVFDLTSRESFDAALAQWVFATGGDCGTGRVLLVGTKLDLPREREVFYEDAVGVAEMHFGGAYVEVSVARAPFVGVDTVARFLGEWTGADRSTEEPSAAPPSTLRAMQPELPLSPAQSPITEARANSPKRKPRVRASVWLYDPTEDHPPSPEHDVKLRPISRALFEIRGAGQEKMKSLAKFKEREVSKLMQRSKYYGPTESSRHMRWQEEQRRKVLSQQVPASVAAHRSRPRSASHGAISSKGSNCSRRREHEQLDAKSFVQSTELLRQRKLELMARKALLAANASALSRSQTSGSRSHGTRSLVNPQAARDAAQQQNRTRKFAGTTLSSVPEEDRCAVDDISPPMSPTRFLAADDAMQVELSPIDTCAPVRFAMELLSPGADEDTVLHLESPTASPSHSRRERRATIEDAPSSYSRSPFGFEDERMSSDDRVVGRSVEPTAAVLDEPPARRCSDEQSPAEEDASSTRMNSAASPTHAPATADDLSTDIDDMLDYFDGVTLPL